MTSSAELVERIREYTAIRYAGDCKCGKCRLVPREVIDETMTTITTLQRERDEARARVEAVDLYGIAAEAEAARLREAITVTRRIVSEAAMEGFNWKHGDWVDRLFKNQAQLTAALEVRAALSAPPSGAGTVSAEEMRASEHVEQHDSTFTAGIDVLRNYDQWNGPQWHYSAIEFHHKDKEAAEHLRDAVLRLLKPGE